MKRLELQIANGTLSGRRFEVGDGGLRLGRSSSNDIHIPDEELSRNHCLFEPVGEAGVRVTDLASANGTLVNGELLGGEPRELKAGDWIEVGATKLKVVGEKAAGAESVDLGLGAAVQEKPSEGKRRSPLANVLWGVLVLVAGAAIYLVLTSPQAETETVRPVEKETRPALREVCYEKVEATLDGIFRYELTVSPDGTIRVTLDDTKENRHPKIRPRQLGEAARRELAEILAPEALRELEPEIVGVEPDPPALNSWTLRVVHSNEARKIRIVNAQEPEDFRAIREKLEAFCNNELGIHALQYPREKLIALAEESIRIGQSKWADREVQHGNLHGATVAFRQAIFYLETIDPKPTCVQEARSGLEEAEKELERRVSDQRFLAERALKLKNWDEAQRELSVLLEMVPDRNDARYREASAKLVDVEKRLKGGR